jgi:hypothetical protein
MTVYEPTAVAAELIEMIRADANKPKTVFAPRPVHLADGGAFEVLLTNGQRFRIDVARVLPVTQQGNAEDT